MQLDKQGMKYISTNSDVNGRQGIPVKMVNLINMHRGSGAFEFGESCVRAAQIS